MEGRPSPWRVSLNFFRARVVGLFIVTPPFLSVHSTRQTFPVLAAQGSAFPDAGAAAVSNPAPAFVALTFWWERRSQQAYRCFSDLRVRDVLSKEATGWRGE